jgi:flagellin-like hook-associated protein FlgL
MSGLVGGPTDYAFGAQLIANSGQLKQQVDKFTLQSSDGYISPSYSGLGAGAATALSLQPQVAGIATSQADVSAASTRMQATQTIMTQLTQIATNFETSATQLGTTGGTDVDIIASQARNALQQVAGLLNTQSGGVYLFAGQDTGNPPVPDPAGLVTSPYFTAIQTAVSGLATNGAVATEAATLTAATTAANSPLSATLSMKPPVVDLGDGQQIAIGISAGANLIAVIPGTDTTGSYVSDLLRALATLGSLNSNQTSAPGFSTLAGDVAGNLQNVVSALGTDSGALGAVQDQVTATGTNLSDVSMALKQQVSNVEDVDIAATATQLTQAQTQLQASYKLISELSSLSLVNYL